jgi:hypothetical protein
MNLLDFAWVPGNRPFALGGALRASRSSRGGSAPFRKDYPLIVGSSTEKGRLLSASGSWDSGRRLPRFSKDQSILRAACGRRSTDQLRCERDRPSRSQMCGYRSRRVPSQHATDASLHGPPSGSHFHYAVGRFISQFFMSAAWRSCSAFLIASDRFHPGGNVLACARASDARAAQS